MLDRRRYHRPQPPDMLSDGNPSITVLRTSRARQVTTEDRTTEPVHSHHRFTGWLLRGLLRHWSALLVAALLLVGLSWVLQSWVLPTWSNLQDQWHTGDAHITQLEANVGHGGVSHFLAEYYRGKVMVIEIPNGDIKNTHLYSFAVAESLATSNPVITLSIRNSNSSGKPNLLVQIEGDELGRILYNNGNTFQSTPLQEGTNQ